MSNRVDSKTDTRPVESYPLYEPLSFVFRRLNDKAQLPIPETNCIQRLLTIIEVNNQIADFIHSPQYQQDILAKEKKLKGDCKTGAVICIDGRIPIIHLFGRSVNVWEEAGSVMKKNKDSLIYSGLFQEILKSQANDDREMLEIVTAHTSLTTDHGCGAIALGIQKGKYGTDSKPIETALMEANNTAQAIEKTYNDFRNSLGKMPLEQAAITALVDTDTMGWVLNYGKDTELSTTKILREGGADELEKIVGENLATFGRYKDIFTNYSEEYFLDYSQKILAISEFLCSSVNSQISQRLDQYITGNFPSLTKHQQQALRFTLSRTIAVQYLTGLSKPAINPHHSENPFAEHAEAKEYMAMSGEGKTVGRFSTDAQQVFGCSPSTIEDGIDQLHIELNILDTQKDGVRPYPLFLSYPVDSQTFEKDNQMLQGISSDIGDFFARIVNDPIVNAAIKEGKLLVLPVFVDQDTGKILKILDLSNRLAPPAD